MSAVTGGPAAADRQVAAGRGPLAGRPAEAESDRTPAATRPAGRAVAATLALLALLAVALVPRVATLGQHVTADEDLTLIRSANVALALERRDWWGTYQIGHPEATVQLAVALGLGPDALRPYAGEFLGPDARVAAAVPGYLDTLVRARLLLAPVHALLIVLAAGLVWRLWGRAAGLLGGLLLATEPFLVAHGRILRTDALLSELMLVAVLAALVFWSRRAGGWALATCIVATGLALVTKTPALALFGAVPAAALAASAATPGARGPANRSTNGCLRADGVGRRPLALLAVWLVGSLGAMVALWPAMWARPLRALERMAVYTQEKGGSPMDAGSFFLGVAVPDPGPLYYVPVLALRLGPALLAGLALWGVLRAPRAREGVALVLACGLGLAVVLAMLPKKADRYILPALPFLAVVAGVGLAAAGARWRRLGLSRVLSVVGAAQVAMLVAVWPYPLAAYNPALGGAPAAARAISVGWGEGLDRIAPILDGLPDHDVLTVSTPYPEVLQAQIAGRAVDLDAPDLAEYAVRYVAASQRHLGTPALDAALAGRPPLTSVWIAGIEYATLHEFDRPTLAGGLRLRQLDVAPGLTVRRGWVTVRLAVVGSDAAPSGNLGLAAPGPAAPGLGAAPAVVDVEVALVGAANPNDADASVSRPVAVDGAINELRLRAPNGLGRYLVSIRVREAPGGAPLAVLAWPVGSPRLADRLVFPSLSVRVQ